MWWINCLGWKFLQRGRIHVTLTKIVNKLISIKKNRVFISLVGLSEARKLQLIYNWLKNGTFQPKFDKIYFFYQHSQPVYDVMQKEIENLEFLRGVKFEFTDSVKNNGTKYLLLFDDYWVFRLHAILHDAAGAVRAHSGKRPGYCYMIERGPNSCLLGHVTGLLYCLYVKLFLPSIFNSVGFWSSMSLIVLDIELTEKNIIKKLDFFIVL